MQKLIILLALSLSTQVTFADTVLKTLNAEVAKQAVASYNQGHYRYLQDGQLIEAYNVDENRPACILESGKMSFDPEATYKLLSSRSLDVDGEAGEIELSFETKSEDVDSYFEIYCFQPTPGANLETAQAGLKSVFEIQSK